MLRLHVSNRSSSSSSCALGALFLSALFSMFVVSSASAQVIYEPVQHQYFANGTVYYYGGSDPDVHAYAHSPVDGGGSWGRVNGHAFAAGDLRSYRKVQHEPVRTFTDALPYINATFFGYTPRDARNEAYARVPRYFTKRCLLNAAVPAADGSAWIVPAQAQPICVERTDRGVRIGPANRRVEPRPLIIIPKDQFERHRNKGSDRMLAANR